MDTEKTRTLCKAAGLLCGKLLTSEKLVRNISVRRVIDGKQLEHICKR